MNIAYVFVSVIKTIFKFDQTESLSHFGVNMIILMFLASLLAYFVLVKLIFKIPKLNTLKTIYYSNLELLNHCLMIIVVFFGFLPLYFSLISFEEELTKHINTNILILSVGFFVPYISVLIELARKVDIKGFNNADKEKAIIQTDIPYLGTSTEGRILKIEDTRKNQFLNRSSNRYKYLKKLYNEFGKTENINETSEFIGYIEKNHELDFLEESLIFLKKESESHWKSLDLSFRNALLLLVAIFPITIAITNSLNFLKTNSAEKNLVLFNSFSDVNTWVICFWGGISLITSVTYLIMKRIGSNYNYFVSSIECSIIRKEGTSSLIQTPDISKEENIS